MIAYWMLAWTAAVCDLNIAAGDCLGEGWQCSRRDRYRRFRQRRIRVRSITDGSTATSACAVFGVM